MSIERYLSTLSLSTDRAPIGRVVARGEGDGKPSLPTNLQAAVDAGGIVSFVSGVDETEKTDILLSVQFAQRAANAAHDRFAETRAWYGKYCEVLEAVGWATEQFAFAQHQQERGDFSMDKAALAVIAELATGNQLGALTTSISALEQLAESDGAITIFDYHAVADLSGNFQLGAVEKSANGALSMAAGAFYFHAVEMRRKFLFWKWGVNEVNFWTAAQKMTLNTLIYDKVRSMVEQRLGAQARDYVVAVPLA